MVDLNKNVSNLSTEAREVKIDLGKVEKRLEEVEKKSVRVKENEEQMTKITTKLEEIEKKIAVENMMEMIASEVDKATKQQSRILGEELKKLKDQNTEMDTKLETAIETKLLEGCQKPLFSDMVSRQVDSKFEQVTGDISKVQHTIDETKKNAEEEKDKSNRAMNLIIYRADESTNGNRDEQIQHDKFLCLELFKEILETDFVESDIKTMFRIGKKDTSHSTTSRPLMVQFKEKSTKNAIMECLNKLKNAPDKYKKLSITHDMTLKEREECKMLVEEAKKKETDSQGEFLFRVRGPPGQLKLVRVKRVSQQHLTVV